MFDKEEGKAFRKKFWTGFGRFMGKHSSVRGRKQKWLNYRTGVKHLYFRMDADKRSARISIDIQHPDPGIRELFYEQWCEYQALLKNLTGLEWTWLPSYHHPPDQEIARIYVEKEGVNLYKEEDWPTIWAWFEPIMLGLDELWGDAVDIFQDLAK